MWLNLLCHRMLQAVSKVLASVSGERVVLGVPQNICWASDAIEGLLTIAENGHAICNNNS